MTVQLVLEAGIKNLIAQPHSVIFISAENCNPCKIFEPTFLKVSEKFPDIKFGKFVLPLDPNDPAKKKIASCVAKTELLKVKAGQRPYGTPTTVIVKNGERVAIAEGALSEEVLTYFIENEKLPTREPNPEIAALPDDVKELAAQKFALHEELGAVQKKMGELHQIIQAGKESETDKIEIIVLGLECDIINQNIVAVNEQLKLALSQEKE